LRSKRNSIHVLLKLYKKRADLQKTFPEVREGDLKRLIDWAAGVTMRKWVDSSYTILQPFTDLYSKDIIKRKIERFHEIIYPLLKCINCGHSKLQIIHKSLKCKKCSQIYPIYKGTPVMTLEPKKSTNFDESTLVSHEYPDQLKELIKKTGNELALDLGSSNNPDDVENLVKLDILCFPTVDVVGDAENLPFKNECFRMVISRSAFEHIRDIEAAANNIFRVLKPDGEVYIEAAFLQPLHSYPDHYYNMTVSGLENLFSDFKKIESGIRDYQYPSFTIKWILRLWAKKMPPEERKKFLKVRVGEIIKEYERDPFSKKWLTSFNKQELEELACGVFYHGKKA
jgi:SAM-dependent methyltransferase